MSDNFIETEGNVILIKITPHKKLTKKWFWYKKLGVIRGKLGTIRPYNLIDDIQYCKEDIFLKDRSEMQVGDTYLVKFKDDDLPKVVDVIGIDYNRNFIFQFKNNQIRRNLVLEDYILISNNTDFCSKPPRPNLIDARTEKELDVFEKIYYLRAVHKLYADKKHINFQISSEYFINLHKILFGEIYSWAGKVRNNPDQELVVGDRNYETLEPLKVVGELKEYFLSLPDPILKYTNGSKRNLAVALADIHGQLAWIHPFIDGNGRTIRLFCQLIALHYGYILDSKKLTKNDRSYYNFAIRCHIKKHPKHLIEIFDNAMIEVPN